MPSEKRPRRVRTAAWWPVLLGVVLLVLVFQLLHAQGANVTATPEISSVRVPGDHTAERSAAFMYTDAQSVAFECSLDSSRFGFCGDGVFGSKAYPGPLRVGPHEFAVRATSADGVSAPALYEWAVVEEGKSSTDDNPDDSDGSDPPGNAGGPADQPPAGTDASANDAMPFDISGSVQGLVPGITKTIVLTLSNPNADPIYVTSITVGISSNSTPTGCPSDPNLTLQQATAVTSANPVQVPAGGSVTLDRPPRAPALTFNNLPHDQDACKARTFALAYTGSAHS